MGKKIERFIIEAIVFEHLTVELNDIGDWCLADQVLPIIEAQAKHITELEKELQLAQIRLNALAVGKWLTDNK